MKSIRPDSRWQYPACLAAGALTPLAFAPWKLWPLAILMPAVLLGCWLRAGPRRALMLGYLYGLGLFGVGVSWLHISINLFGGINFLAAMLLTFLFVAVVSLYPAMAGYLASRLARGQTPLSFLLLVAPALWVLLEWLRGWLFTGFPWLNLGYSQIGSPLDGLAPLAGVYAVSWAVMVTAGALAGLILLHRQWLPLLVVPAVLWTAAWLAGGVAWTQATGEELEVALVQGAVPQELKWQPDMRQVSMDLYLDLSRPYLGSDLIIWPETAIPAFQHQVEDYLGRVAALANRHRSRVLVGIPVLENGNRYYNSIMALQPEPRRYDKRHLVPFGEYMPLGQVLNRLLRFLEIPMSDFSAGRDVRPLLEVNGLSIGVSICYEDAFGEEVIEALPEAGLLVNVSNDAWFGDSAAPHQHLQMARMRSRETGRYMLRATNTGISAVIDERGGIRATTPQFEAAVLAQRAQPYRGSTPYVTLGNYPVVCLALLLLTALLLRSGPGPGTARRQDVQHEHRQAAGQKQQD